MITPDSRCSRPQGVEPSEVWDPQHVWLSGDILPQGGRPTFHYFFTTFHYYNHGTQKLSIITCRINTFNKKK